MSTIKKKTETRKLKLRTETLRELSQTDMGQVAGGGWSAIGNSRFC